jgi:response regulator RpfG family c-di-GMP phosphodiesterase
MQVNLPAIVLIEKDEITLDLYQRELSKSFEVSTFTEIDGVLEALANQEIRAIIIEPEIGSGQGWELIDSIERAFLGRRIPVIVCSTRDPNDIHQAGSVAKYLIKPVLPKVLKEKTLEVIKKENFRRDI